MKKYICFLFIVCVAFPVQARKSFKKCVANFEAEVQAFREEMENVGLAVVFVKGNKIVYHNQFGVKIWKPGNLFRRIRCLGLLRYPSLSPQPV